MLPQKTQRQVSGHLGGETGSDGHDRQKNTSGNFVAPTPRVHPTDTMTASGSGSMGPTVTFSILGEGDVRLDPSAAGHTFNEELQRIYNTVSLTGRHNFAGARQRVPSGLCITAWRGYLQDYHDHGLVDYLAYGWPVNFNRASPLCSTYVNHATARAFTTDVGTYIQMELGFGAMAGPFDEPPVPFLHVSPLMTRPKKDSDLRRVITDLSWPPGASINDGIVWDHYIDGPTTIKLPTVEFMENRLMELGRGAYMYKSDLARGYRQLRVDPLDWPLLGLRYEGKYYVDICPPFGLRTSALFMQRTSEAITYIHGTLGYRSRPYLDDFGGAERTREEADDALNALQGVMHDLGVVEAPHKVCRPAQVMVWLGISYDSREMTMTIPEAKMGEIAEILREWEGRRRATQRQMQSLLGLLQFVASVSPPARVFTNRMLQCLRECPRRGSETLSLGFRKDLRFFIDMWPDYNGIRLLEKHDVECQADLELDACLTGCGAYSGAQFYAEEFPEWLKDQNRPIADLELLNVVVALKTWATRWARQRVHVACDNTTACLAIQTGRSRCDFVQGCIRELFLVCSIHDIQLRAEHRPGAQMQRADALSRAHLGRQFRDRIASDSALVRAVRVRIPEDRYRVVNDL